MSAGALALDGLVTVFAKSAPAAGVARCPAHDGQNRTTSCPIGETSDGTNV